MKSTLIKTAGYGAVALSLGLLSVTASGGFTSLNARQASVAEPHGGEQQRPAGDRELPASRDKSPRYDARPVVKCWQEGRLIFEEHDWHGGTGILPGPVLRSTAGDFGTLHLSDFGETFCIIKNDPRGD